MDDTTFDFPLDSTLGHEAEARDRDAEEAALEAIRVAINNNNNHNQARNASEASTHNANTGTGGNQTVPGSSGSASGSTQIEQVVHTLQELVGQGAATASGQHSAEVLSGVIETLSQVGAGLKKQEVSTKDSTLLDPALAQMFVPRFEYNDLKQKYDVLLASVSTYSVPKEQQKLPIHQPDPVAESVPAIPDSIPPASAVAGPSRKRKVRQSTAGGSVGPEGEQGEALREASGVNEVEDKVTIGHTGRKRRSIKLEHLVHQMANRRLGLEYPVAGFRVSGFTILPDPATPAPPINMSLNGIQEYRPDFTKPVEDVDVMLFIGVVVEDAWAAWNEGVGEGEVGVDLVKVQEAVRTYWTRLQKRWLEQEARTRGEVHKDELTRRKQNQYRRQQSLVGRRIAAFDSSPLNACRLRALYRTLLTIDFASPTNERPDPSRVYTEDQWLAYRRLQLGSRAEMGHEVVDIFWLSPAARSILILLDTCASARPASGGRKKGRPKAPSPTFHLPETLWDSSPTRLPLIRPKDSFGLPIPDTPGMILFTFHVHPDIIAQYPSWASGLYDDPPPHSSDTGLGSLAEVLSGAGYEMLRARVKKEKERAGPVDVLSDEAVKDILARMEDGAEIEDEDEDAEGEFVLDLPALPVSSSLQLHDSTSGPGSAGLNYGGINMLSGLDGDVLSEGLAAGLESYVALNEAAQAETEARLALQAAHGHGVGSVDGEGEAGPSGDSGIRFEREGTMGSVLGVGKDVGPGIRGGGSVGTSVRARKMGKKAGQGLLPEGAAMPVPKRQKVGVGMGFGAGGGIGDGVEEMGAGEGVEREIMGDVGFLEAL